MVPPLAQKQTQKKFTAMGWFYLCLTALLCILFAKLGSWQLNRAQEKIDIIDASTAAANASVLTTVDGIDADTLYRKVRLSGIYDFERQFLRDNRIHNQQAGYEVLTPFQLHGNAEQVILVNRGWLPQHPDRTVKPDITVAVGNSANDVTAITEIEGILVQPSKGFTLGPAIDVSQNEWPLTVQFLDYETIALKLDNVPLRDAVVVLDAKQPLTYVYNWQAIADGPEKHYGYAFQWFAMLLAVLILYFYLNFVSKK